MEETANGGGDCRNREEAGGRQDRIAWQIESGSRQPEFKRVEASRKT